MENYQSDDFSSLKIVTMNILAPCYNKVGSPCNQYALESEDENMYMERHRTICDKLLKSEADIICLQEFWSGSTALRNLYINELCRPETDWYKSEFEGTKNIFCVLKVYYLVLHYLQH